LQKEIITLMASTQGSKLGKGLFKKFCFFTLESHYIQVDNYSYFSQIQMLVKWAEHDVHRPIASLTLLQKGMQEFNCITSSW
jgi:hypothetical protein